MSAGFSYSADVGYLGAGRTGHYCFARPDDRTPVAVIAAASTPDTILRTVSTDLTEHSGAEQSCATISNMSAAGTEVTLHANADLHSEAL